MSIQWNKEVKMKDIAKFFNQEIKLGEVNYNKCLQVSTLIVAFGVIPSFTYGTVLGSLDAQREALMIEVNSLKAEMVTAAQSIPKASSLNFGVVYNATTDKTAYTAGSPVTVTYYNSISTTTSIISLDLYNTSGTLVQKLATMSPYQGLNKYTFNVATSSLEKGNTFFVRVNAIKFNQSVDTNKFEVKIPSTAPKVEFVSSSERIESNIDYMTADDEGVYKLTFDVWAESNPIYIELGPGKRGTVEENTAINYTIKTASTGFGVNASGAVTSDLVRVSGGTLVGTMTGSFVKIAPYTKAQFAFVVYLDPVKSDAYKLQLHSVNYNTEPLDANTQLVVTPAEKFQSAALIIENEFRPTPVDVTSIQSYASVFRTANVSLTFNLNNVGKQDMYISRDGFKSVEYEASQAVASSTLNSRGSSAVGDTQAAYIIKAGTKRSFELNATMVNKGPEKMQSFVVKKIRVSDQINLLQKFDISSGLENLKITQSF